MEHVNCPYCQADDYRVHLVRGDLSLGQPGEFRLVRCNRCDLVYLNPRPARQELEALYPEEYDQYTAALKESPRLARWDRRYGLRKRCQAILRFKSAGRLLDVGCATGDFLDVMREFPGWQVMGVELSAHAANYARLELGLDVLVGTLEENRLDDASFDVVTLWNVLEHLPDPLATLREIRRILKPGGLLVMNTPNLDSLDARLYGPYWIGYELPRHFCVFSYRTLRMVVDRAGFHLADARCLYGSHAAAASSIRFWLRAHGSAGRRRDALERVLFSRATRLLTLPYFFVADRLRLSTALTAFCLKEN